MGSYLAEVGYRFDEMGEGASKPVKAPDNKGISLADVGYSVIEAYPLCFGS
jgi:hypothetical protein